MEIGSGMKVLLVASILLNIVFLFTLSNVAGRLSVLQSKWVWLNQKITEAIVVKEGKE